MENKEEKNIAYIDGQNLYMGTSIFNDEKKITKKSWLSLEKFRFYLKRKYNVETAYYFLGVVDKNNNEMYEEIQKAGFILVFRKHNNLMLGSKKGNVDVDLVFSVMEKIYRKEIDGKIVLISGDGDYIQMVEFLIKENKFEKVLFPNKKRSSSLYKDIDIKFVADLSDKDLRKKISK